MHGHPSLSQYHCLGHCCYRVQSPEILVVPPMERCCMIEVNTWQSHLTPTNDQLIAFSAKCTSNTVQIHKYFIEGYYVHTYVYVLIVYDNVIYNIV